MLNDLRIKNFRMLEDLHIAKLGRVNLIVGKNNCGKSTVLEALRLYACRFHPTVLQEIFQVYGESPFRRTAGKDETYNWAALKNLFPQRRFPERKYPFQGKELGIRSDSSASVILSFNEIPTGEEVSIGNWGEFLRVEGEFPAGVLRLYVLFNRKQNVKDFDVERAISREDFFCDYSEWFSEVERVPCSYVSTQLLQQRELSQLWDATVLTPDEDLVLEALQLIEPNVHAMRFISDPSNPANRMSMVRLKGDANPVPLASMGDGMSRILQVILKLLSARNGFLLIDEFENGLHFSVQEKVWRMIFKLANDLNIQVFATTHSWDCIESFTKVAQDNPEQGILFKLSRSRLTSDNGKVIATEYDENELGIITSTDLEVR
jgi:predicted ATPase